MDIEKELATASEFYRQDDLEQAKQVLHNIVSVQPENLEVLFLLAEIAYRETDFDTSSECLKKAIHIDPQNAEAFNNLGLVERESGKFDRAEKSFLRAISLSPDSPGPYYNLGNIYREKNRPDDAIKCYRRSIQLAPDFPDAYINLGKTLQDTERYDEAIQWYKVSLQKYPDNADIYNNLGITFQKKGLFEEAITCYQEAVRLSPGCHDVYNNLGFVFEETGRVDEAIALYRRSIELNSSYANAHWNLARALLLTGEYEEGWKEYEWRWKADTLIISSQHSSPHSRCMLENLSGRTVLLHAEQGFGDNIQFIRYAPMLAQLGAKVVVESYEELIPLFESVEGVERIIGFEEKPPPVDQQCHLLSLPLLFKTGLEDIPASVPYLNADPVKSQRWKDKIIHDDSLLKIGLVWAGNPRVPYKHLTLDSFAPLAQLEDTSFYSLQKGDAAAQAKNPPTGLKLIDCSAEIHDFSDTAAIISNLDLILSIDTAVAHLAGAMGKPVWTLILFAPDWRWMLKREDSPWYPTMRLFRQPSLGDWTSVIAKIYEELWNLIKRKGGCTGYNNLE